MEQALEFSKDKSNCIRLHVKILSPPDDDPGDCLNLFTNNDLMHSYWKQVYSDPIGRDEEFDSTSGGTHIRGSHDDMVKLSSKPFLILCKKGLLQ